MTDDQFDKAFIDAIDELCNDYWPHILIAGIIFVLMIILWT